MSHNDSHSASYAAAGVDIILGNHPHVVQSMGTVTGTDENGEYREVFYIWSIGNFISAMTKEGTDCGIILDFTIEELDNGRFAGGYLQIHPEVGNHRPR